MERKEPILIKVLRVILIVACMIGGLIIGFYKVENQDIRLKIFTDTGTFTKTYSAETIQEMYYSNSSKTEETIVDGEGNVLLRIDWSEYDSKTLKSIKVYRKFNTISIAKVNGEEIWKYGNIDETGILLNREWIELLYRYSTSFLLERMIYAEILVTVFLLLWVMVNALKEKMDPENRDNHGPIYEITSFFKNLMKYREYMIFAAKADLQAEVANSYLNRLWWILEPFCNMLVYVIVFGRVMGNSIERYATFVFSALIMWNFFSHIINYSVKCVRFNRDIVTKIYVPKYILLITNMVLNFIKLMFSIAVLVVMLAIFKTPISWAILWVIPAYVLMLVFSFGLGMIFLHYGVFIDDLGYAVGILLTLLMFLSGIFYDVQTTLAEPLSHIVMCCNPMVVFIDTMRNALLYQEVTYVPLVIIWTFISLLIGYIGVHIVNKNENGYVKVI